MIRIKLLDGTVVVPSKRQVNNKSGKSGRRAYDKQRALLRVGGVANDVRAIYHGSDKAAEGVVSTNYDVLCRVVDPRKRTFTDNLGGSTPCGYVGGRGA